MTQASSTRGNVTWALVLHAVHTYTQPRMDTQMQSYITQTHTLTTGGEGKKRRDASISNLGANLDSYVQKNTVAGTELLVPAWLFLAAETETETLAMQQKIHPLSPHLSNSHSGSARTEITALSCRYIWREPWYRAKLVAPLGLTGDIWRITSATTPLIWRSHWCFQPITVTTAAALHAGPVQIAQLFLFRLAPEPEPEPMPGLIVYS